MGNRKVVMKVEKSANTLEMKRVEEKEFHLVERLD
jgi:hypothetical protein